MPAKKLENLKYDDYVAKIKKQYNIKYHNEFAEEDVQYYENVKAKIANDASYDPEREFNVYNDKVANLTVLSNDINNRLVSIKHERINKLDTEEYRQAKIEVAELTKNRDAAKDKMDKSYFYLVKVVDQEIKDNPEYGLKHKEVIENLVKIYKEHVENPNEVIMFLPTARELGTKKGNVVYAALANINLKEIEDYSKDRDEYDKQVGICALNQEKIDLVENTEKQIEETRNMSNKDLGDNIIVSDGLKYAKSNSMTINEAIDFYTKETKALENTQADIYANSRYMMVNNSARDSITKNQTDFFDDLASAMKEESNLKGYQKFFAKFLPGSIYGPSAIMNKVKALNAVLQESEFPQEKIDEQLAAAQERLNQPNLDDFTVIEKGENGEIKDIGTVEEIREKVTGQEAKNLSDATEIENKNTKKTEKHEEKDMSKNKDLEMDGQPEFNPFE